MLPKYLKDQDKELVFLEPEKSEDTMLFDWNMNVGHIM